MPESAVSDTIAALIIELKIHLGRTTWLKMNCRSNKFLEYYKISSLFSRSANEKCELAGFSFSGDGHCFFNYLVIRNLLSIPLNIFEVSMDSAFEPGLAGNGKRDSF